jgi:hypothetical protein
MPKLRLLGTLCALVVLSVCLKNGVSQQISKKSTGEKKGTEKKGTEKKGKREKNKDNMDTPIVVSDDLHFRHAHHQRGNPDVQIQSGQVIAFSESGDPILYIRCNGMTLTPGSNPSLDCINADYTLGGDAWELDVTDADGKVITFTPLSSAASTALCNSSTDATCGVMFTPSSSYILWGMEDKRNDDDTKDGTDVAVQKANGTAVQFVSAVVKDTKKKTSETMNCNSNSPKGCDIRFRWTPTPP